MGWLLFIGLYFSLSLLGVAYGLFRPFYMAYLSNEEIKGKIPPAAKALPILIKASALNALRFGAYTFIALCIIAAISGILFTIWAIFHAQTT